MKKSKKDKINYIKKILGTYGCFSIGELDINSPEGVCVNTMGPLVALAEYFTEDYTEINIYNPASFSSDPIEDYEEKYENLSEDVLHEILNLCQYWEAQSIRDLKRISN